jgi:hypothetical protein
VFGPVLKSSMLPLPVLQSLHGGGVDGARVGSWRGCVAGLFLAVTSSLME